MAISEKEKKEIYKLVKNITNVLDENLNNTNSLIFISSTFIIICLLIQSLKDVKRPVTLREKKIFAKFLEPAINSIRNEIRELKQLNNRDLV